MKLEECEPQVEQFFKLWFVAFIGRLYKVSLLLKLPKASILPSTIFKIKMHWEYKRHNYKCIEKWEKENYKITEKNIKDKRRKFRELKRDISSRSRVKKAVIKKSWTRKII